jgi:hypothetical protein
MAKTKLTAMLKRKPKVAMEVANAIAKTTAKAAVSKQKIRRAGSYSYFCCSYTMLYILMSLNLTFVFAENVLVLDGKTEIFPPEIPAKAKFVTHNVLAAHMFNVLTGCQAMQH